MPRAGSSTRSSRSGCALLRMRAAWVAGRLDRAEHRIVVVIYGPGVEGLLALERDGLHLCGDLDTLVEFIAVACV